MLKGEKIRRTKRIVQDQDQGQDREDKGFEFKRCGALQFIFF